nr:hypothetical protein [uncultured Caproiciproducens sp.]
MKLLIKNYFIYYLVMDENKKVICKISRKSLLSIKRKVHNSTVVITTDIMNKEIPEENSVFNEGQRYIAYDTNDQSKVIATASLFYKSCDRKPTYINRLPDPDSLIIQSIYGEFMIRNSGRGRYPIYHKSKLVGSLKCFSHTSFYISKNEIQDPFFIAVLFVFINYMDQESDFLIV